ALGLCVPAADSDLAPVAAGARAPVAADARAPVAAGARAHVAAGARAPVAAGARAHVAADARAHDDRLDRVRRALREILRRIERRAAEHDGPAGKLDLAIEVDDF